MRVFIGLMLAGLLAACASQSDVRQMRRPALPPQQAILADPGEALYNSVALYEIVGAPEYRLMDAGVPFTTRPTRRDVRDWLNRWLLETRLLAPDVRRARYLLSVEFTGLRGPDLFLFSDKNASSSAIYRLTDVRTGLVVFEMQIDSAFNARMPGVTPDMVRQGITTAAFGGLLVGGVNSGSDVGDALAAVAFTSFLSPALGAAEATRLDTLLTDPEQPGEIDRLRAPGVLVSGTVIGTLGVLVGKALPGDFTDLEAGLFGGLTSGVSGFLGAAPVGLSPERHDSSEAMGAFNGVHRRNQAVAFMLRQSFSRFLLGLAEDDWISVRRAVPCEELNRDVRGNVLLIATDSAVGYDCRGHRRW